MEEILQLNTTNPFHSSLPKPPFHTHNHHYLTILRSRLHSLPRSQISPSSISTPYRPPKLPTTISLSHVVPTIADARPISPFHEKLLYLESLGLGLDPFSLADSYPPIISASLSDLRSTFRFLRSLGLPHSDLRRALFMCPAILTTPATSLAAVVTFLLREALLDPAQLRRALRRRPRLLASDVASRLRPTLYFLRSIGVADVRPHASLLSCSVEDKLLSRLHFLLRAGFSRRDALTMLRRFPPLFCYGIRSNFEPKLGFLLLEMRRDLDELRDFPQYFSFSLEGRIKPRHRACSERGLRLPLPAMLRSNDDRFIRRLEACVGSSTPCRSSPLYSINSLDDDDNYRFESN